MRWFDPISDRQLQRRRRADYLKQQAEKFRDPGGFADDIEAEPKSWTGATCYLSVPARVDRPTGDPQRLGGPHLRHGSALWRRALVRRRVLQMQTRHAIAHNGRRTGAVLLGRDHRRHLYPFIFDQLRYLPRRRFRRPPALRRLGPSAHLRGAPERQYRAICRARPLHPQNGTDRLSPLERLRPENPSAKDGRIDRSDPIACSCPCRRVRVGGAASAIPCPLRGSRPRCTC